MTGGSADRMAWDDWGEAVMLWSWNTCILAPLSESGSARLSALDARSRSI
jgi:hypothetical protein